MERCIYDQAESSPDLRPDDPIFTQGIMFVQICVRMNIDLLIPLKPTIKLQTLFCCFHTFLKEVEGRTAELSTRFILSYLALNSRRPSILESIGITRRILILIALSNLVWHWLVTCPLVNRKNCSKNTYSCNNNLYIFLKADLAILSLPREKKNYKTVAS